MYTTEYYKIHCSKYKKYQKICNLESMRKLKHMCNEIGDNGNVHIIYREYCGTLRKNLELCNRINITKFKETIIDKEKE
jgi:hypothetical protein